MLEPNGSLDPKTLWHILAEDKDQQKSHPEFWIGLEAEHGESVYAELLYLLTRLHFEPHQARKYWFEILDNRNQLSQRLDRNVGLRVALCDYFVNIRPEVENPMIVEVNLLQQKEQSALRDELTGLYNRRFFNSIMQKQMASARRFDQPFSLLMLDVDNFKRYNDTLGHQAGDQALAKLAQVLGHTARALDYLVRYGGEEFAVILPGTDQAQAMVAAERHRQAVEVYPFFRQECMSDQNLTVSIGVACYPNHAKDSFDLVYRADQALYQAKGKGRNQVCCCTADRRRHPRVPFRTGVDIAMPEMLTERLSGETRDISLGGVSLLTNRKVQRGKTVRIFIQLPDSDNILELEGVTVNILSQPNFGGTYQLGVSLTGKKGDGELRSLVENRLNAFN